MMPVPRRSPHSISHPGLRRVSLSRIKGRTHVSTRPRATPLLKISLAPQGASTHVANSGVGRTMGRGGPRFTRYRGLPGLDLRQPQSGRAVERLWAWLKERRAVAARYEKTTSPLRANNGNALE